MTTAPPTPERAGTVTSPVLGQDRPRLVDNNGGATPRTGPRGARPKLVVWEGLTVPDRADPYLSLGAAASYTSLSARFLRARLTDPRAPLPHYRVGGRVLTCPSVLS